MGCTTGAMKCVVNIMNVLLALSGIAIIVLASLTLHSAPPVYIYYLFIMGGATFLIAILGCCGLMKENVCMTTTYAVILLALILLQVFRPLYAANAESIKKFATDDVNKNWELEIQHPGAMNKTQQTFYCCGKDGPNDYFKINRQTYPASCYPKSIVNQTLLYKDGCLMAEQTAFVQLYDYSNGGEWSTLVFTAIVFIFAVYLAITFRKKQNRYPY